MVDIHADCETRSAIDIKNGVFAYFSCPHARVLGMSYYMHGRMRRWEFGQPEPADLRDAVASGARILAHNAAFEHRCFVWLAEHEGWTMPRDDQFVCTAAMASAMSLPRKLEHLAAALNLSDRKDKEGDRLIRFFSIPRRPKKDEPPGIYFNEIDDFPEEAERFRLYRDRDVLAEMAADARMTSLSDYEQRVYALGEAINRRGIRIDRMSAIAALRLAEKAKALYDREMRTVTEGAVSKCSEVAKLQAWCEAQGVPIASLNKADITDALLDIDDMPDRVRRALELRKSAAKTSVAKLEAMLRRAGDDSRVRGSFIYHAAGTGRFQSVGVNFANLPRYRKGFEDAKLRHSTLFDAIRTEDPETLRLLYGDELGSPLDLLADSLRSFIWAAPGHDLIQADYAGIEGAVIAWLAGEEWKLKALREIQLDPSLPDLYVRTAAAILGIPVAMVTKAIRQNYGKVSELALSYAGGVGAFYSMARNYNIRLGDLHALYPAIWASATPERRAKAVKHYESCLKRKQSRTDLLSREAWLACETIKVGWREANPKIRQSWYDLEAAARSAVQNPGQVFTAARISYLVKMDFLWARLPSGRCLAYGAPRLKDQVWAARYEAGEWLPEEVMDRDRAEMLERHGHAKISGPTSQKVTALTVDGGRLVRRALYSGILAENATQAVARDLLVNGMFKAEAAGYPIVMHVYDEIVAEIPRGSGDLKAFEKLICELPDWAAGLPLTADGWRGKRYRKE